MKTAPMDHQVEGRTRLAANKEYYALLCEQGTGKTWMLLADLEDQWKEKAITGALVVAPNGVHSNWVRNEIPKHLEAPCFAVAYRSGAGERRKKLHARTLRQSDELVVLAMHIDALTTKDGFELASRFLKAHRAAMIIDESQRIKNGAALRTKRALLLGEHAVSRRIATGTSVTNAPWDAFSQFEFLAPGKRLLGHSSERAFRAHHAELLPSSHRLIQSLPPRARMYAQIVATDRDGNRKWRNLDQLAERIRAVSYIVKKADCLSLPEKIYTAMTYELSPAQRRLYDTMNDDLRLDVEGGEELEFTQLTKITKLQQIASGFVMVPGGTLSLSDECQARMALLMEAIEDSPGKIAVWAAYRVEIERIMAALAKAGVSAVRYQGGMSQDEMAAAIDAVQLGDTRVFVGNAKKGGTGITLTAVETVIYYSCTYNLEERLQSEDRTHRIGTEHTVRYIDLAAEDTIDERIANALQAKSALLDRIMA